MSIFVKLASFFKINLFNKIVNFLIIIGAIIKREFIITYRNFFNILTIVIFFILGIFIFVFATGPDIKEYKEIIIGIIWTLLLFSSAISIDKFYQDDFNDGSIIVFYISSISLEFYVIIKIIISWFFWQLPFFIVIPIISLFLDINIIKLKLLLLSFLIGSPILTMLSSISSSMNLLNDKNTVIGNLIVIILSIPVIIFGVGIINASPEIINPQLNILLGILLLFIAITPWISASCIKIGLRNS
ncbi:MAG: Heme exporter protein B [Alphaproteobacteria bacterium MarineAlpha5_Bin9]|nr:MAG: Heme exporter protein B [Alphaproteobacteria bacterium MarineAlpha5_Bin9]|tara:strand:- start:43201 stop:43932 length:732 start_codon:yes stop_codon:yes gene_type:complete